MTVLNISAWWNHLNGVEQVFWGIAIVFTTLFLIQLVMSVAGFATDTDIHDSVATDSHFDVEFHLFSFRSIIAFFTFFGWVGIIVYRRTDQLWMATFFAIISGVIAMATVAYVMYLLYKMDEEGTLKMSETLGAQGEVYLPIPGDKGGKGKILVNINGSLRELEAWTLGPSLPTGYKIRIVDVVEKQEVLVESDEIL